MSAARFPAVTAAVAAGNATGPEPERFLDAVTAWRVDALDWLDDPATRLRVSLGLRELLTRAISGGILPATVAAHYQLRPFPAPGSSAPGSSAAGSAFAVLVWRAQLVGFLSDVWDTIGPPAFELGECTFVIEHLLTPAAPPGVRICPACVRPLPADAREAAAHARVCPVLQPGAQPDAG